MALTSLFDIYYNANHTYGYVTIYDAYKDVFIGVTTAVTLSLISRVICKLVSRNTKESSNVKIGTPVDDSEIQSSGNLLKQISKDENLMTK